MAQPATQPSGRAAKWRQLVDLLAQSRPDDVSEEMRRALTWLRRHRDEMPLRMRQEVAHSLGGRSISPLLFAFFAEDVPAVAAPLIGSARLSSAEWVRILPSLSQTARSLLRNRRDLASPVEQALASFGSSDLGIAGTVEAEAKGQGERFPVSVVEEPVPAVEEDEPHIHETGAPVEAPVAQARPAGRAFSIEAFRWETGSDGIIMWVADAPRGPLIGQTIASIAGQGQYGVDGQAAGAFEKRAPFRDARFKVAGGGAASGDWRISGVPFFDPRSGVFLGYRGSARRPRLDEVARAEPAEAPAKGLFGSDLPADSLRQLIHELRTPLNAIVGFAEMIDGQYMGPAAANYRSRAAEIMAQATRLLSAVDDLDTAARIETQRLTFDQSSVDLVALLCRLHDAYERVATHRGARIALEIMQDLPPAKTELGAAERMFARMLAATIGLAGDGEVISATMMLSNLGRKKMLCLAIDRPKAIRGLDEAALLDPGYSPEGDWPGAPALGLGFALRLVRNLAEAVGGGLHIGPHRFYLYLPPLEAHERSSGQSS